MDALTSNIEAAFADARRAAAPGSIGDTPDRSGDLIVAPFDADVARSTVASSSPMSIAIDGPGLFVLKNGNAIEFGRLGDLRIDGKGYLCDGAGRRILGMPSGPGTTQLSSLQPIRVAHDDAAKSAGTSSITIDADGYVLRRPLGTMDERPKDAAPERIGRIALAIFAAPETLLRRSETTVVATPKSGTPSIIAPGTQNGATLRAHVLESGLVDVQGDLERIWRLSQQEDLRVGMQAASDDCVAAATALIK